MKCKIIYTLFLLPHFLFSSCEDQKDLPANVNISNPAPIPSQLETKSLQVFTFMKGACTAQGKHQILLTCSATQISDNTVLTGPGCFDPNDKKDGELDQIYILNDHNKANELESNYMAAWEASSEDSCINDITIDQAINTTAMQEGVDYTRAKNVYIYRYADFGAFDLALLEVDAKIGQIPPLKQEQIDFEQPILQIGNGADNCAAIDSYSKSPTFDPHIIGPLGTGAVNFNHVDIEFYKNALGVPGPYIQWDAQTIELGALFSSANPGSYPCSSDYGGGNYQWNQAESRYELTGLYSSWLRIPSEHPPHKIVNLFAIAPLFSPAFCYFIENDTPFSADFANFCALVPDPTDKSQLMYDRTYNDSPSFGLSVDWKP